MPNKPGNCSVDNTAGVVEPKIEIDTGMTR